MAVGERQHRAVVVSGRRETDPRPLGCAEQCPCAGVRAEGALLDALGVFVDEYESLRRGGVFDVTDLMPAFVVIPILWAGSEVHIHVHRHAAHARDFALVIDSRLVGGTLVDAGRVVVLEEDALADVAVVDICPRVAVQPRWSLAEPAGPAAAAGEL